MYRFKLELNKTHETLVCIPSTKKTNQKNLLLRHKLQQVDRTYLFIVTHGWWWCYPKSSDVNMESYKWFDPWS